MAGRWISKWSLSGCLIVGALGCNRNSVQPTDAQPISGFPMTSTTNNNNKSLWGNSTPQPVAEVPVEAPRKGPAKPETDVAIADLRLQLALEEKTPETSRTQHAGSARLGYQKALQQDPKNKTAHARPRPLLLACRRTRKNSGDVREVSGDQSVGSRGHARGRHHLRALAGLEYRGGLVRRALKIDPENLSL